MRVRLLLGVLLSLAVGVGATSALAKPIEVKSTLSATFSSGSEPGEEPIGSLRGEVVAPANIYCEQGRKIEVFRDGKKVGSAESDRYGSWYFVIKPVQPGSYVAKTKQRRLPAPKIDKAGKPHAVFCKAAKSKPIVVP